MLRSVSYGGYASLLHNGAVQLLRPGTYIAEIESSPFIEHGLSPKKPVNLNAISFVFGIVDPSGGKP